MKLNETVEMMVSEDYKEKFKAEYYQTKERYERLKAFNTKIEAAHCSMKVEMPIHECPDTLLREQQRWLGKYLECLEVRAVIENIEL